MTEIEIEVYCEKMKVTEWRDGCVFRTQSLGYGWFSQQEVDHPEHGIIYAPPSAEETIRQDFLTIRRKK